MSTLKKLFLPIMAIATINILFSCKEDEKPDACFTMTPTTNIYIGTAITFSNCSTNATTYTWDFNNDGTIESTLENPTYSFTVSGTITIKLTAYSSSASNSTYQTITVLEPAIDPTDYNGVPGWETLLYDDFSTASDSWYQGSGDTYQAYIANGYYTFIDTDASEDNYGRYYYTNAVSLPDGNYDFEASIRNTDDNGNYGSGIIFGLDNDLGFNIYKYSSGSYSIGSTDEIWQNWTQTSYGVFEDWNKLTVRRYLNKYYFFINEQYIFSCDYQSYGEYIGFVIDRDTHVDVDAVGVFEMVLSGKKSASVKQKINTTQTGNGGSQKVKMEMRKLEK